MPKDFAPGLPSKEKTHDINQSGPARLVIQKHTTKRSRGGYHYDVRLHAKDSDKTHSWVIRTLPGEKQKTLAIRQPTHRAEYSDFEGTLWSGYGAGKVKKVYDKPVHVHEATNEKIRMTMPEGEFVMIKPKTMGDKHWLMIKKKDIEKTSGVIPIFFSKPDLIIKGNPNSNVNFITGLRGSGKTTQALEEKIDPIIGYKNTKDISVSGRNILSLDKFKSHVDARNKINEAILENKPTTVEGVSVHKFYGDFGGNEGNLIVKRTSKLKSLLRQIKRSQDRVSAGVEPPSGLKTGLKEIIHGAKLTFDHDRQITNLVKKLSGVAKHAEFITSKPKYKTLSEPTDYSDNNKVLQGKVDGAHAIFHLKSDQDNHIYSYRNSKRTGEPIDHSDQVPDLKYVAVPKKLDDTVLRGELYATKNNKPVAAEVIGGMLNASIHKSLEKQKEHGKLKPYIFDIVKFKGEDVSNEPYRKKLELMQSIEKRIPSMRVAETAFTPEQKRKLVNSIKKGLHPETKEGVVEWDLSKPTGDPSKIKYRDNFDVYIRKIFPAISKATGKEKDEAGGFEYSLTPKGKIVGNVGTGFTQAKRKDMLEHQNDYLGMVARVKSQQQFGSGALRAPAFYTMDIEKNLK